MVASVLSVCTALSESSISATLPSPLVNATLRAAEHDSPSLRGTSLVVQHVSVSISLSHYLHFTLSCIRSWNLSLSFWVFFFTLFVNLNIVSM